MDFIPVNTPLLDGNEKEYLIECIDTGWISSEGSFVHQLEDGVASYVGRKYGIAVSNGSAALDIAVIALNLQKGDEVIMPAFTIISCAAALVRQGVKPVLVDSDPITWNMNVDQIEGKITKNTKAIMVVHIYGLPVDMDRVLEIANKYGLKIIEDAAEAHGLTYKGKMCGSFGDISIMSFYPNKHITTGEGGMILTDDLQLANRSQAAKNLFFKKERRYIHDELGYNCRMSNLQAAVGVAQLEKIEEHLSKKMRIGEKYQEAFKRSKYFQCPLENANYAKNIYWVFGLVIKEGYKTDAVTIIKRFAEKGIGCRPFFYPMHLQPVFCKMGLFDKESYPVSEYLSNKGFYIPSGLGLKEEEIEYIIDIIQNINII